MKLPKKYFLVIATLLWVAVIFAFSLQPGDVSSDVSMGLGRWMVENILPGGTEYLEKLTPEKLESWHFLLRKAAHFTEYFVLGVMMTFTQLQYKRKRKWMNYLLAAILCILVASTDETIQLFVSGRCGRLSDVLLDSCGSLTGVVLIGISRKSPR